MGILYNLFFGGSNEGRTRAERRQAEGGERVCYGTCSASRDDRLTGAYADYAEEREAARQDAMAADDARLLAWAHDANINVPMTCMRDHVEIYPLETRELPGQAYPALRDPGEAVGIEIKIGNDWVWVERR